MTGDDNLVDDVTTTVRADRLVIDDRGAFDTEAPMSVTVSVPSLDTLSLSGMGTVTIVGVTGPEFTADLSGTPPDRRAVRPCASGMGKAPSGRRPI